MIDLRSDTVTRPTPEMRQYMMQAAVGDDVYGEDPTVNALQKKVAQLFGFEAGLFVPTGVMGNQIGLKLLTDPGDEVIIEEKGHGFNYESTSAAMISGIQLRPVAGRRGKLGGENIRNAVRAGYDMEPRSRAVVIENTTNKGGGACYSRDELQVIRTTADSLDLSVHLDGARIWNAIEAADFEPQMLHTIADTMSVCFSKGLGAPVGSMILSSSANIKKARRYRKMLGGGMRQIGILAAAAEYAIDHHRSLLKADHRRARALALTIDNCNDLAIDPEIVETNILIFDVTKGSASEVVHKLKQKDILITPFGADTVRATFHFQITDKDLERVQNVFMELFD